ncbi:DNA polymerase III subunit gamma/tau [Buchnera aphidicola (Mollitrichosiphum nigrofasciatum)]|uniref:DNA polymerase III subunit gamma/tau n=1 Tax=Buchnera aphidicola TaxID=9 RepID=UPI0031B7F25D
MTYEILARKWRPKQFRDVIGQKYVLKALSNSISLGRIHQTWLFTGMRGTGKTTIARILAKNLCCEKGVNAKSCDICSTCVEIDKGNFIDLIEVDAASRTKVEEIKELLDNIQYKPIKSRFRIYLIDEIHMLSRYSFNALLKTLEEPPKHVKFILATTEIEKIPETIISRCMIFHLKKIKESHIKKKIIEILNFEKILIDKDALNIIAETSQGSMRDALNLLELAITINNKKIKKKHVINILGKLHEEESLKLLIALLKNNKKKIIIILNNISISNTEWKNIFIETLRLLHHIAMIKSFKNLWNTEYKKKNNNKIKKIAHKIPSKIIYKCYKILTLGFKELNFAPSQRIGVEITLLKILYYLHKKKNFSLYDSKKTKQYLKKKNVKISQKTQLVKQKLKL